MPKEEAVKEEWKIFDIEKFPILNFPPNISIIIKSRRMIWVEHVARMGNVRDPYKLKV
jgi:hypothetical protein